MRPSNVCASVAIATYPLSRASAAFLADESDRPAGATAAFLPAYAANVEEDDRRLIGDVADRVLDVHQQAITARAQLARPQAAVELERVRAGDDVAVEPRTDRLVAALDQEPRLPRFTRGELDRHAGLAAPAATRQADRLRRHLQARAERCNEVTRGCGDPHPRGADDRVAGCIVHGARPGEVEIAGLARSP